MAVGADGCCTLELVVIDTLFVSENQKQEHMGERFWTSRTRRIFVVVVVVIGLKSFRQIRAIPELYDVGTGV